ncbi:MAG: UDP-glucose 4-epimerase GalE [Pseudobdellovibrionaceae bacterium]
MKTHILVTGGAGYIGSHTCLALHDAGFIPVAYDNLSRGHSSSCQWGPLVKADLRETSRLIRTIKEYNIKSVIHFAAFAYVGESVTDPSLYYDNNVMGTLSLLQACEQTGVAHLIFSSSCATYGIPEKNPIDETTKQNPVNPYGHSKKICEQIISDYQKISNLKGVCLRYFNAAGNDPENRIGENHDPETHLIPNVIKAALGYQQGLQIFGNDYPTPDGTCIRDYLHVMDLAQAHLQTLRLLIEKKPLPFALNLGTGHGQSVKEIVQTVTEVTGRPIPIQNEDRRPGDPPMLVASAALAAKEINFKSKYDIKDCVKHATAWMNKLNSH